MSRGPYKEFMVAGWRNSPSQKALLQEEHMLRWEAAARYNEDAGRQEEAERCRAAATKCRQTMEHLRKLAVRPR